MSYIPSATKDVRLSDFLPPVTTVPETKTPSLPFPPPPGSFPASLLPPSTPLVDRFDFVPSGAAVRPPFSKYHS